MGNRIVSHAWKMACVGLMALALTATAKQIAWSPDQVWNGIRLMAPAALKLGAPLYPVPGEGPVISFCYGPLNALMFVPPMLAKSAAWAIIVASLLSYFTFTIPAVWAMGRATVVEGRSWGAFLGCVTAFLVAVQVHPALRQAALSVVHDTLALGFGCLSLMLLFWRRGRVKRIHLVMSALLFNVALWTKQPIVFMAPGLFLCCYLRSGFRALIFYGGLIGVMGCLSFLAFSASFGSVGIVWNMVLLPTLHGKGTLGVALFEFAHSNLLLCVFGFVYLCYCIAGRVIAKRGDSDWSFNTMGFGFVVCGFALVPASLLGVAKIGGDINALAYTAYFLLLGGLFGACDIAATVSARLTSALPILGRKIAAATLLIVGGFCALTNDDLWRPWPEQSQLQSARVQRAIAARPGHVYYAYYPLEHVYAENRVYHCADGINSAYHMCNIVAQEEFIRKYLPEHLDEVFVPERFWRGWGSESLKKLFDPEQYRRRPRQGQFMVFAKREAE